MRAHRYKKVGQVILTGVFAMLFLTGFAQKPHDVFRKKIENIIAQGKGNVGVGIMGLEDRETFLFNEGAKYPMQSVYKFPLAMAVLDLVDKGKLSLNQKVRVTPKDLLPNTWSPIREKYPKGNVDLKLSEILSYTVSQSDNNGCDILFRLVGGPKKVHDYIQSLGVKSIAIAATEEEMHRAWNVQFTNWCKPKAMLKLLDIFYKGKALSKTSNDFLWKIMTETVSGPNKIKGLLPKNARVAHKTGLSDTNAEGVTAATNDVGILTLPNGEHVAVVIFVSNTTADEKTRDGVMAKVAKASWDYFLAKK